MTGISSMLKWVLLLLFVVVVVLGGIARSALMLVCHVVRVPAAVPCVCVLVMLYELRLTAAYRPGSGGGRELKIFVAFYKLLLLL